MSIRFRLTLTYSTILTLTLVVFGLALYTIQAQDTLNSFKQDITFSSSNLVDPVLRMQSSPNPPRNLGPEAQQPRQFDEFSGDQEFMGLREREIVRVLDADGNLIVSPFGRMEDALPLSDAGLDALQNQQDWWEDDIVSDEHMLIYSRPVVQEGETTLIIQVARSLTERDRTLKSLATTLTGAGLLTILVAFGVGWAISGLTLRPINHLTQTAKTIGSERDFTKRVDYSGPRDEVGRLAETFNQMLSRLQDAYQKVEQSLQQQRDFVADVSHELRTPLTTIRGNLGLLKREPPMPSEEQEDILSDLVDESDRLIRLVNDLLDLARVDAGRDLECVPLEIQPIISDIVRQMQNLNEDRKIELRIPPAIMIEGDRDGLKQVILILLDNALKYSTGNIEMWARQIESQVEICVKDFGGGVPPDVLANVFDRFYRSEEHTGIAGFGLGLPIAKALVEAFDGSIEISSELGKGSIVVLRFPSYTADGNAS